MFYAWITPDDLPTGHNCWQVLVPDDPYFEAMFRGALLLLTEGRNFEQVGDLTPTQCADLFWSGFETSLAMVPCGTGTETGMAIGTVFWFAGEDIPDNCLVCDGSEVSAAVYAALYAVIGNVWGGNSTVFNLPDLQDSFLVGAGDTYSLADTGGEETHTLIADEVPVHSHGVPNDAAVGTTQFVLKSGKNAGYDTQTTTYGNGNAHNNLPPYTALIPVIVFE